MKKTLLTIDDDLLDFLRSDAAKERRSMSAQICVLLELCQKFGGYSGLLEKVVASNLQSEMREKSSSRSVGRPRKPGTITEDFGGFSMCALKLYNQRKKKSLIVKFGDDYRGVAKYIRESLEAGMFPHEELQRDFSDDCDSFVIRDAVGDTMDDVLEVCENQGCALYDGWLDLSSVAGGSAAGHQSEPGEGRKAKSNPKTGRSMPQKAEKSASGKDQATPEAPGKNQPEGPGSSDETHQKDRAPLASKGDAKRQKAFDRAMMVEWDDVDLDDAKTEFKKVANVREVKSAAKQYIAECYSGKSGMGLNDLAPSDILNIMQDLQQEYYSQIRAGSNEDSRGTRKNLDPFRID